MPPRSPLVAASVKALYPARAHSHKVVRAWKPTGDKTRPDPTGSDGWVTVLKPASEATLQELRRAGYTWVNLEALGVLDSHQDAELARL